MLHSSDNLLSSSPCNSTFFSNQTCRSVLKSRNFFSSASDSCFLAD
uniref:Uncharacterized protein n=1 Tax=Arundo donax TaxID=35708 RepID=A0A0A9HCE5_ARUDO